MPQNKKALFEDKKDGFRRKLFAKAAELDKDVIEKMKLRFSELGSHITREMTSIIG
jgi:hypothetical protein